ncbi:MAG: glycosyltransferase [Acidobacteria bacterium]|nr:MAG: glycosyltransferase [Acidobacteriota bacterium]
MTLHDQSDRRRVPVLGLQVDLCSYDDAIRKIIKLARAGLGGYVSVANVHVAIEARDDPAFEKLVNDADLVLPDGTPLVWMQRLQGNEDAEQVRGPSLMPMLMKHAEAEGLSVGFLGARPEVLEQVVVRAAKEFPDLQIPFHFSPPFRAASDEEKAATVQAISESNVQILFVGLGCPKQERWMAENREKVNAVMIGVGAAFDLYAGNIREAPGVISKLGLEWMFRLVQEPRRLFSRYLLVNPRFIWLAASQLIRVRSRPKEPTNND